MIFIPGIESVKKNHLKKKSTRTSWWFQPIGKICSSNWGSFPPRIGVKIENLWKHHLEIHGCTPVDGSEFPNNHLESVKSLKIMGYKPQGKLFFFVWVHGVETKMPMVTTTAHLSAWKKQAGFGRRGSKRVDNVSFHVLSYYCPAENQHVPPRKRTSSKGNFIFPTIDFQEDTLLFEGVMHPFVDVFFVWKLPKDLKTSTHHLITISEHHRHQQRYFKTQKIKFPCWIHERYI